MINLDPESLAILRAILREYVPEYEIWLFGSRATNHCKPYSDIDLAIISPQPISDTTLAVLKTVFSESDLPYKVDLIDFAAASETFQKIILQHHVPLFQN